jgi:hypothetical protein
MNYYTGMMVVVVVGERSLVEKRARTDGRAGSGGRHARERMFWGSNGRREMRDEGDWMSVTLAFSYPFVDQEVSG